MIIVTGSNGFIGRALCDKLEQVFGSSLIVKSDPSHNLTEKVFRGCYNPESLIRFLDKCNKKKHVVVHLGACSDTTERNWKKLHDLNYDYSIRLFEICQKKGIRFIYASSAATYGNGEHGFDDAETDLKPLNLYGWSKHLFDLYIRNYYKGEIKGGTVGLKFFNVYGKGEGGKGRMASMAYHGIDQVIKTNKIRLFKNGQHKRDFIHIDDVTECIIKVIQNQKMSGIYNLGTGVARSFNDLANCILNEFEHEDEMLNPVRGNIEYFDMPEDLKEQYQDYTCADMTKFNKEIKHEFMSLEEGIKKYVDKW